MKISEAFKILKQHENISFANAFLQKILKKDSSYFITHGDENIDKTVFWGYFNQYLNHTPFEYIFKSVNFFGLDFYVDERVLIPRFDSEILLENTITLIKSKNIKNILEIGFGSGVLSICLDIYTNAKITACDISKDAMGVAEKNQKIHKSNVEFFISDFMDINFSNFDLIISNPPYIANNYLLDDFVLKEPKIALFGGDRGDEILRKIIEKSAKNQIRYLACEFGYDQKKYMQNHLQKYGYEAQFYKDYGGFDRAFVASLNKDDKEPKKF